MFVDLSKTFQLKVKTDQTATRWQRKTGRLCNNLEPENSAERWKTKPKRNTITSKDNRKDNPTTGKLNPMTSTTNSQPMPTSRAHQTQWYTSEIAIIFTPFISVLLFLAKNSGPQPAKE